MGVTIISYLLVAFFFGATGATAGVWFGRRNASGKRDTSGKSDGTREALRRIQMIAESMASDLHTHQTAVSDADGRLQEINVEEDGIEAVVQIVADLVENNALVQRRLAQAEDKLDRLAQELVSHHEEARTDALTGCANRRAFDEELAEHHQQFVEQNSPYCLLMLDIDHFKRVNDSHGHGVGDEVLRMIGRVLRNHVRGTDLVARYGGEEFAVIMPGFSLQQGCFAAESLRTAISGQVVSFPEGALKVTASLGVCEAREGEDSESTKQRADESLYAAKKNGRNCVYWHDGLKSYPITEHVQPKVPSGRQGEEPVLDGATMPAVAFSEQGTNLPISVVSEYLDPDRFDGDILHNLPTRTSFCQEVRRRIAEWQRGGTTLSVVFVELCQAKELEEAQGTESVSVVMSTVANVLQQTVREMDVVARYAGNSLGVLMPSAAQRDALFICERIRKAIKQTEVRIFGEKIAYEVTFAAVEVADDDDMQRILSRASQELEDARKGVAATRGRTA